jgi:altronate dehydratase large subunit
MEPLVATGAIKYFNWSKVIGLGCEMVKLEEVVEGLKESQKPVAAVSVHELGGMLETINKGAQIAADLVLEASKIGRERFGLDKLCFCTKCGSSDTTSGLSSNLVVGGGLPSDDGERRYLYSG